MNRRDFIKRGAVGAASAAIIAAPVAAEVVTDDFPETEEAMRKVIKDKKAAYRSEGMLVQEGLSMTTTGFSTYWYYLKGDRKAVLRENTNGDSRFYVEHFKISKPIYYPPLNYGRGILEEQRDSNWPAVPSKRR